MKNIILIPFQNHIIFLLLINGIYNVKWELKCDFEINQNNIKYKVEISESKEDIYNKIYEGNNNFCVLENIKEKEKYNFRICLFYNGIVGIGFISRILVH